MHGEEEEFMLITGGKVGRKRTTKRPRRRWDDTIQTDLTEIGWGGT
jgi:hypothetical protein